MLTAAELLRQHACAEAKSRTQKSEKEDQEEPQTSGDLDEEIRRLEAELANDDDDDDSSSDSDDSSTSSRYRENKGEAAPAVLSLSQFKEARIESLPPSSLPAARKRSLKIDEETEVVGSKKKKSKKEKGNVSNELEVSQGLKSAVQEILRGYQPRSAERLPFYCRVCAKQYDNEEEFLQHKGETFHKTAVAMERKASCCKLCRKQLTSPAQLQEHLRSRPHKQRLDSMKARQQGGQNRTNRNSWQQKQQHQHHENRNIPYQQRQKSSQYSSDRKQS